MTVTLLTDKDLIPERLHALTAAGYRRSDWTATDSALHSAAKWADGRCILDHREVLQRAFDAGDR